MSSPRQGAWSASRQSDSKEDKQDVPTAARRTCIEHHGTTWVVIRRRRLTGSVGKCQRVDKTLMFSSPRITDRFTRQAWWYVEPGRADRRPHRSPRKCCGWECSLGQPAATVTRYGKAEENGSMPGCLSSSEAFFWRLLRIAAPALETTISNYSN